jgi:hypothetical protein
VAANVAHVGGGPGDTCCDGEHREVVQRRMKMEEWHVPLGLLRLPRTLVGDLHYIIQA